MANSSGQNLTGLDILKRENLKTEEDIHRAVDVLEGYLDDESIGTILQLSLQRSHAAFELIVSSNAHPVSLRAISRLILATAVSNAHANLISKFILDHFPSNVEQFYDSIAYKAILTLTQTLQGLSFSSCTKPNGLDDHLRHTKVALTALGELHKQLHGGVLDSNTKPSKMNTRRSRPSQPSADVEAGIERLEALGLRFPKTRLAAKETVQKILETQRTILRVRSGPLSVSSFSAAKPY